MDLRLVIANLRQRPARALATATGVALGVVLVVVTVGLAHGMLASSGRRDSRVGAEILFQPPGGFGGGLAPSLLSLPVASAAALARLDGVAATTPVGRVVRGGASGIGFELIEGVSFAPGDGYRSYPEITGIR